jgi:hypothetical protein
MVGGFGGEEDPCNQEPREHEKEIDSGLAEGSRAYQYPGNAPDRGRVLKVKQHDHEHCDAADAVKGGEVSMLRVGRWGEH